ncbi:MAG: hypothetical protein F6K19_43960, partial [Cyanothece sp. SIO1E1]|nr:hypothetical protein [Cyanothece sp. SIO1E1]
PKAPEASVTEVKTPPPPSPSSPPLKPAKTAKKSKPKSTKRDSGWQQYTRTEFDDTSLPDIVELILQRQPNQVLEIPEVVSSIFVSRMPKDAQGRAHARISNILAEGARNGRWYRGRPGCYSMSKTAVAAD